MLVEPWPTNGVPHCVVDRFLHIYYNTHHGIRGKPLPASTTTITVERQLGMAALRESDFDGRLVRRCVRVGVGIGVRVARQLGRSGKFHVGLSK